MRPFFIGLSISLGFTINPLLMAQNAGPEIQNKIQNFKMSKHDIRLLIEKLLKQGKITKVQASEALDRLSYVKNEDLTELSFSALTNIHLKDISNTDAKTEILKRSPSSLPVSPFFGDHQGGVTVSDDEERMRIEKVQANIHQNLFKKKKFQ